MSVTSPICALMVCCTCGWAVTAAAAVTARIRSRVVSDMAAGWMVVAAGVAVTLADWTLFVTRSGRAIATRPPGQGRRVRISGSYQPSEVRVRAGTPTRLMLPPRGDRALLRAGGLPGLRVSVMLPPFEDVAVDLPASEPRRARVQLPCRLLHGTLVVDREVVAR